MNEIDVKYVFARIDSDINGFPVSLVIDIIERTKEYQPWRSESEILERIRRDRYNCFSWSRAPEGFDFWAKVVGERDFVAYFSRFPERANMGLSAGPYLNCFYWE